MELCSPPIPCQEGIPFVTGAVEMAPGRIRRRKIRAGINENNERSASRRIGRRPPRPNFKK
jgi:hypothetical protein